MHDTDHVREVPGACHERADFGCVSLCFETYVGILSRLTVRGHGGVACSGHLPGAAVS